MIRTKMFCFGEDFDNYNYIDETINSFLEKENVDLKDIIVIDRSESSLELLIVYEGNNQTFNITSKNIEELDAIFEKLDKEGIEETTFDYLANELGYRKAVVYKMVGAHGGFDVIRRTGKCSIIKRKSKI